MKKQMNLPKIKLIMNKKIGLFLVCFFLVNAFSFSQTKVFDIAVESTKKSSAKESIEYLEQELAKITTAAEKRALYIFLGSVQEQMADFTNACKNYAKAAGISAGDVENMPKKSNEQLVLDAVRCALSYGDADLANLYLNSAVRNSKNAQILSYVKLYAQWSALCKANDVSEINEPLEILKAYLNVESMKVVRPSILLTLWYITGEKSYSEQIISDFPTSVESAIVKGDIHLLPTPFWFFVPKSGIAEIGTGTYTNKENNQTASESQKADNSTGDKVSENAITKLQLGLFRTESNAKLLKEELIKKGFEAYITSEKRASGTTYYIVLVDEDKDNSIAEKLRSSGYECYAVE